MFFLGQRAEVVRRIAHAVILREDEVPNLHRFAAVRRVVIDFAARSADAVGPLGRSRGRPEVFFFAFAVDAIGGEFDFVVPDVVGLVIVEIDGDGEPFGIEAEPVFVGQKFPGPVDGFFFEVIAEGKIAEHLKKRVVISRHADVGDVAGAEAFLAGGGPRELQFADA